MAMAVPSRFACLTIEDDDFRPRNPNKDKDKKKSKTTNTKPAEKKAPKGNNNKPSQSKPNAQPKKKKVEKTAEQWEQWKQKDSELVNGCYEDDLQQALLLSKLEYEEKKQNIKQGKKISDTDKKQDGVDPKDVKKNKNKTKVMSLDQFNNMVAGTAAESSKCNDQTADEEVQNSKEFFTRLELDTKGELTKEHLRDAVLTRQPPTTEVITSSQYKEQLEKKDEEIKRLQSEIIDLKAELITVKTRNKKLCGIIGQGEMRDKAEVLVEVDRLTRVQVELTAEVQSLHAQLEQEKSKVHYLTEKDHKGKDKKKRDNASAKAGDL